MSGLKKRHVKLCGALAQLGERNTGSVEVSGSIPLGSTILQTHRIQKNASLPVTRRFFMLIIFN